HSVNYVGRAGRTRTRGAAALGAVAAGKPGHAGEASGARAGDARVVDVFGSSNGELARGCQQRGSIQPAARKTAVVSALGRHHDDVIVAQAGGTLQGPL